MSVCRLYVLYRLPGLKFLDSTPVTDKERRIAQKQGAFLKVVKPDDSIVNVRCMINDAFYQQTLATFPRRYV